MLVIGSKIKLLDRNLIRRFGGLEVIVDPSVAKVLVNEGLAVYIDNIVSEIKKEKIDKIVNEKVIFPSNIISVEVEQNNG